MFFVGLIIGAFFGILVSIMMFVTILFLRVPIEKVVNITEKKLKTIGPRPQGAIYEPMSEGDEERERIIRENKEKGLITKVSELISE